MEEQVLQEVEEAAELFLAPDGESARGENMPLYELRKKETELSGQILAAKREAEDIVAKARKEASDTVKAAREEAEGLAMKRETELMTEAAREAEKLKADFAKEAEEIRTTSASRLNRAARSVVDKVMDV